MKYTHYNSLCVILIMSEVTGYHRKHVFKKTLDKEGQFMIRLLFSKPALLPLLQSIMNVCIKIGCLY